MKSHRIISDVIYYLIIFFPFEMLLTAWALKIAFSSQNIIFLSQNMIISFFFFIRLISMKRYQILIILVVILKPYITNFYGYISSILHNNTQLDSSVHGDAGLHIRMHLHTIFFNSCIHIDIHRHKHTTTHTVTESLSLQANLAFTKPIHTNMSTVHGMYMVISLSMMMDK